MIDIYGSNNQLKCSIAPGNNSQQDKSLGGDNLLTLSFVHNRFIALDVNDWCMFNGERYWMQERYLPTQKSSVEWDYDVKLYGIESLIKRLLVLKNPDGENEVVFTLTASASEHVRLIISSINAGMDSRADWKMGTVIATENLTIDYNGIYCDEALRKVAEAANTEWWIEGQTVNVCRCEQGEELTLRYPESITRLERDTADGVKFYTRLFPMGSARNIDRAKYGHVRLQLPDGQKYVDMNVEKYGIFHHYEEAAFADIYPRRIGTVSDVRETSVKDNDGKPFKIYWFKDSTLPFNPNDYEIGGLVKHVVFQSGELNGRDFEVNYHANTKEFEIITTWPYNDGTQLPGGLLVPKKGDKYILWNIRMPDEYYGLAEAEFLTAVKAYNAKHCTDTSVYKCSTHHVWIERGNVQLCIGRRIRLESSSYFPEIGFRNSRITRITRSVALPSQMDLEISDTMSTGNMTRLTDNINEAKTYAREALGALPDIIHCGESTLPTDNNLFSARRIIQDFLSKDTDAKVRGLLQFLKGIGIGEQYGINAKGEATISSLLLHALRSYNFNEAEQRGFAIHRRADGKYQLSLTDIIVWGKAIFNELELRRLSYVGGNMVFSACGSKVTKVEDKGSTWRCYFRQDDGSTQTQNLWQTDDLARAETFNLKGKTNRHYWRRVTSVGEDWIELSKTDCEQGSDAPQVDDALVQMGSKTKPERQGLIMVRTMGEQAIIIYSGINGYTLEGKAVALLSPSKVDISANIFRLLSPSGSAIDLKGKDGRDGKSSYTFTRYSDDDGKTFTKSVLNHITGDTYKEVKGENRSGQVPAQWNFKPLHLGMGYIRAVVEISGNTTNNASMYFQAQPDGGMGGWDVLRTAWTGIGNGKYIFFGNGFVPEMNGEGKLNMRLDNVNGIVKVLEIQVLSATEYKIDNLLKPYKQIISGDKISYNEFARGASGNVEQLITFYRDNTDNAFVPGKLYCVEANVKTSGNVKSMEVFIYDNKIKSINRVEYANNVLPANKWQVIKTYIRLAPHVEADWSHVYVRFDNNGSLDTKSSYLNVEKVRVSCIDDLIGINQADLNIEAGNNVSGTSRTYFTEQNLPNGAVKAVHVHSVGGNGGIFFPGENFVYPDTSMDMKFSVYMRSNTAGLQIYQHIEGNNVATHVLTTEWKRYEVGGQGASRSHILCLYTNKAGDYDVCCPQFMIVRKGEAAPDWLPSKQEEMIGMQQGSYLGIASWDKPYPPLDPQMYQWSSTTDKEAMKKAQEAIKAAETANSTAASAATKASDATKRAGEVELKMEQGEFIVRADKTRFQNNKGQDVAVFNADGTINARAIMAKGTGGTAYFGLYNDAPAMIFTNATGQTTALMTNQGILKPADCVITLRDTKGSMLFKEMYGTTIRAYFTYYIAIRVVNTGFQRTLFGDDTLSPHAQLSLSARFEEYAGSDMQLRCVEPKWIEPQKEQTIVYRATTDHLYPKRYLSAETEFRVSWYAAFEGKVIMAGNFNAREAASKGEGYVSFDY